VARTAHGQIAILGTESAGPDGTAIVLATWPLRIASGGMEEPWGLVGQPTGTLTSARPTQPCWRPSPISSPPPSTGPASRPRPRSARTGRNGWPTDACRLNARTLSRVLELEVARASRQGTELSVAIFDIDGLASANAGSGPAAGDDILREVAAVLAESVRLVDTVARWGGDEFLVVAPGAAGMTVARRVLEAVE
jgi:hypothetical protein